MRASTHCPYSFFMEIGTEPEPGGTMLHRESIQDDLGDLVDEVFVTAILADALPEDPVELHVEVAPVWREEPWAEAVLVTACPRGDGSPAFARRFETGRWMRRAQGIALRLESEEAIPKGATAYVYLLAERSATAVDTRLPALLPPFVEEQSLEDLGVMELGGGSLCPDRPILVNQRMVDEILDHTERAGSSETGGGTLGKMIRLPEPLPDTTTRVVTVLTASLTDDRHVGELARFTFDPEALHEAARIADLRGRGEAGRDGIPHARVGVRLRPLQSERRLRSSPGQPRLSGGLPGSRIPLPEQDDAHADRRKEARRPGRSSGPRDPRVARRSDDADPLAHVHRLTATRETYDAVNDHVRLVTRLLAEAGYELDGSPRDQRMVLEATKLLDQARLDPVQAVAQVLSARMAAEKARASTKKVMESVEALHAMLEGLLDGQHLLCRLQGSSVDADNNTRASVIVGGQLREVSVHPDVDPAELGMVLPWHYVCLPPNRDGRRGSPERTSSCSSVPRDRSSSSSGTSTIRGASLASRGSGERSGSPGSHRRSREPSSRHRPGSCSSETTSNGPST